MPLNFTFHYFYPSTIFEPLKLSFQPILWWFRTKTTKKLIKNQYKTSSKPPQNLSKRHFNGPK